MACRPTAATRRISRNI